MGAGLTQIPSILGLYLDNGKYNGNYYSILGLYWDNGKQNGNYYSKSGYIGIMENNMETTIVYSLLL